MANMIRTVTTPDNVTYDVPGKSYASTSAENTPNVEKFEGTTPGTLVPSADTYGKIYVVPTPAEERGSSLVAWEQYVTSGTKIGKINIDGTDTDVYAPTGGSGGSTVAWNQIVTEGNKIAEITIDGTKTSVYAKGTEVEVNPTITSGTKVGAIKVDSATYNLFAPALTYSNPDSNTVRVGTLTNGDSTVTLYSEGLTSSEESDLLDAIDALWS